MVRLKAKPGLLLQGYVGVFQFLMVRLKVYTVQKVFQQFVISIPYGAIKSISTFRATNALQVISIPYGAIKSRKAETKRMK